MDKLMAFLMKYVGGFFTWWQKIVPLPTVTYREKFSVNWSMVSFMLLVWIAMWLLLP